MIVEGQMADTVLGIGLAHDWPMGTHHERAGAEVGFGALSGPAVLYIGGYGRSGSTILEMMLSAHPAIVGGGEIFRLPEIFAEPRSLCTCGLPVHMCPVWSKVRPAVLTAAEAFGGLRALQAEFTAFEGRLGRGNPAVEPHWQRINMAAFAALKGAKPGAAWVVDSSKTARWAAKRPARLEGICNAKLRLILLRRRPAAVMSSASKGSNRAMEAGVDSGGALAALRAYGGWILATASAASHARRMGDCAKALTYEAMVDDPGKTFSAITEWLGLPPCPDWEARMLSEPRHLIGGNRARFSPAKIRKEIARQHHDKLGAFGEAAGRFLTRIGLVP